ncbi:MAG: S41 family peptidase, partial [Candidatus Omnitrophota bacterium]
IKKLRGKAGTPVKLTIWRDKEEKILDVAIKRAIIKLHSIKKSEFIEGKIGYIRLVEFQENTPKDLEEALVKLESQGLDALILDLRYNPGGLLDCAVDVSEKFLTKDKVIVSIKSRDPAQNMVFKSSGKFLHPDYPLIVMVNEGSASASEIVAGAVQDNKRGIVLGTKTFGKASVQSVISLKDGSALRITSALYYTPSGKLIKGLGIIPDVVVEREEIKTSENKDENKSEGEDIFEKAEAKSSKSVNGPGKEEKIVMDNQLNMAVSLIKAMKIYKSVKP